MSICEDPCRRPGISQELWPRFPSSDRDRPDNYQPRFDRTLADGGGCPAVPTRSPLRGQLDALSTQAGTLEVQLRWPELGPAAPPAAPGRPTPSSPTCRLGLSLSVPVVKRRADDDRSQRHLTLQRRRASPGELMSTIGLHLGSRSTSHLLGARRFRSNTRSSSATGISTKRQAAQHPGAVRVGIAGTSDPTTLLATRLVRSSGQRRVRCRSLGQGSGELEVLGRARVPDRRGSGLDSGSHTLPGHSI